MDTYFQDNMETIMERNEQLLSNEDSQFYNNARTLHFAHIGQDDNAEVSMLQEKSLYKIPKRRKKIIIDTKLQLTEGDFYKQFNTISDGIIEIPFIQEYYSSKSLLSNPIIEFEHPGLQLMWKKALEAKTFRPTNMNNSNSTIQNSVDQGRLRHSELSEIPMLGNNSDIEGIQLEMPFDHTPEMGERISTLTTDFESQINEDISMFSQHYVLNKIDSLKLNINSVLMYSKSLKFDELCSIKSSRIEAATTFVSLLYLCKSKYIKIKQNEEFGTEIHIKKGSKYMYGL
ncbi:hypothetical protein A3Q56_00438 [Intoshia linei]|uniref:Rad21/Rec8-like protein C-terminal eukaryotic domain-containing protein n=1 Tax=Intoshia linei TaxID=1819745 RepID=A0A177BBV9_9BILA|nr:hypothetical protein A3Q56_00438 [Intoshia linei]